MPRKGSKWSKLPEGHGHRGRKRTKTERERDLALVAQWYYKDGISNRQRLADMLNAREGIHYMLTRSTVSNDLEHILENWRKGESDPDVWVEQEIQRIHYVEAEAWEAWERSKQPKHRDVKKEGHRGDETWEEVQELVDQQVGDRAYLDLVMRCISERGKIRGLYTQKIAIEQHTTHTIKAYAEVSPADWDKPQLDVVDGKYEALPSGPDENLQTES